MAKIATTRILYATPRAPTALPWVWPLPRLDGIAPSIVATHADGVELGYAGRVAAAGLVPVFAARDGIVTYAARAGASPTVWLDHADGWSSQYAELEHVLAAPVDRFRRRRKPRVRAGDIIGHARRSTLGVRFALSRLIEGEPGAADAAALMAGWSLLPWFDEPAGREAA
mgnify:CR=1 FL=1